jgi:hypothetical protein
MDALEGILYLLAGLAEVLDVVGHAVMAWIRTSRR